jgi:hypothetical protein
MRRGGSSNWCSSRVSSKGRGEKRGRGGEEGGRRGKKEVSSVTGVSPFELLHGFPARTPISLGFSSVNGSRQAFEMALENANRAAVDRAAAEQARVGRILAGRR